MLGTATLQVERLARIGQARSLLVRPLRSVTNPGHEVGDLCIVQAAGGRHQRLPIASHRPHDEAARRITRNQCRARVSPLQEARKAVKTQVREHARSRRAMAPVAALGQQRTNALLEVLQAGIVSSCRPWSRESRRDQS